MLPNIAASIISNYIDSNVATHENKYEKKEGKDRERERYVYILCAFSREQKDTLRENWQ